MWTCTHCSQSNLAAAAACAHCATPRAGIDHSMSGDRTQADAPRPSTPRPAGQSISGDRTYADSATPTSDLMRPGLRVGGDGRYELIAKLGEGGMGSVWRAKDLKLTREVAIKRIRGATSPALQERFLRETRALTGLSHPNVVTVFDAGEDAYGNYLVMELVSGKTLAQRLKEGPIEASQAVELFCAMCKGMSHAHKRGVIHRDLKPSNVMLNDDGVARILDFGLVRLEGSGDLSLSGVGLGTLDYASPEQKQDGGAADERSDVFALGLVFYEMLTGRRPAPLHLHKVGQPWRDVLERATEPLASDRYASMEEMLSASEAAKTAITHEDVMSQAMGKDDDLRCPKCRLVNTLEAKFCRSCRESLRQPCPACNAQVRTGLKHCDQCAADIRLVTECRAALASASSQLQEGLVSETVSAVQAVQQRMRAGALGDAAEELDASAQGWLIKCGMQAKQARELAGKAGEQEALWQFEEAQATWDNAAQLDADLREDAAAFRANLPSRLQSLREEQQAVDAELSAAEAQVEAGELDAADDVLHSISQQLSRRSRPWAKQRAQRAGQLLGLVRDRRIAASGPVDAARAAWSEGEFEESLEYLRHAAKLDARWMDELAAKEGESASAIAARDQARAVVEALRAKGLDAQSRGDLQEAVDAINAAQSELRVAGALFARQQAWQAELASATYRQRRVAKEHADSAHAAWDDGEFEDAMYQLRRAASLDVNWASVFAAKKQVAAAAIAARDMARRNVDDARAQAMDANVNGDWPAVIAALAIAKSNLETAGSRFARSQAWLGDVQGAIDLHRVRLASKARIRQCLMGVVGLASIALSAYVCMKWNAENARLAALEAAKKSRLESVEVEASRLSGLLRELAAIKDDELQAIITRLAPEFEDGLASWRAAVQRGQTGEAERGALMRTYGGLVQPAVSTEARCLQIEPILGRDGIVAGFADPADWLDWCGRAKEWRLSPELADAVDAALTGPSERMARLGSQLGIELDGGGGLGQGHLRHTRSAMRFVSISAGSLDMGSASGTSLEWPVHRVRITRPFWMATTEVTQQQYEAIMGKTPSKFHGGADCARRPVESVSWEDAVEFCETLAPAPVVWGGVRYGFRLPTEAEWEYCCRAGTTTEWHTGGALTATQANFEESNLSRTAPVGSYGANAWGLFDMHGNVWELCIDAWDRSANYPSSAVSDPYVSSGPGRVLRGGSWANAAFYCRSAYRNFYFAGDTNYSIGFRVVLAPVLVK